MAAALADLPEEIKHNILHNIKKVYLSKDLNEDTIRNVLVRENWDLTKAVHILNAFKSYMEKNKINDNNRGQQNSKKKNKENKNSPQSSKNKTSTNNPAQKNKKSAHILPNKDATVFNDWVLVDGVQARKTTGPKKKEQNRNESSHGGSGQENPGVESKQARKKRLLDTYNKIRLLRDSIDRIKAYIREGIKVIVLMRGCSGSGKTTYVKQILRDLKARQPNNHIFSTDNYFLDDNGIYHFHCEYLPAAHEWNQKLVRLAMSEGRSPIFVDNTNTRLWEMREYAVMATENGYVIETLEPPTSWFNNEEMLHKLSSHSVPRETIRKMLDRYEANISGNNLLRYLDLDYKCSLPRAVMSGLSSPMSKQHMKVFSQRLPQSVFTSFGRPDKQHYMNTLKTTSGESRNVTSQYRKLSSSGRFPHFYVSSDSVTIPAMSRARESFQSSSKMAQDAPMNYSYVTPNMNQIKKSADDVDLIDFSDPNENYKMQLESSCLNDNSFPYVTDSVLKETQNLTYLLEGCSKDLERPISPLRNPKEWDVKESGSESSGSGDTDAQKSESESEVDRQLEGADDDSSEVSLSESAPSIGLEYVLISEDNLVTFQKEHTQLANIKTLEEFKKTSDAVLFSTEFDNFLKIFLKDSVFEGNVDNQKIFPLQKQFIDEGSGEKNVVISESEITNEWEFSSKNNLKALQMGSVDESFIGDWDYKRELPKEIRTEFPKEKREPIRKLRSGINTSTNTNYLDFEMLKGINGGSGNYDGEMKVIEGKSDFVSIPGGAGVPSRGLSGTLMLDKSSMTSDIETSQVVVRDSGIERLVLMFPSVSRDNLEELFDKCQRDIDWTVGLLLDSNHEMSEMYTSMEAIECSQYEDTAPETNNISIVEEPVTPNKEVNKKCKKKKICLSRSDNDLYKQIQDKIILNEDHYTDHMKRVYQMKRGRSVGGGGGSAEVEAVFPEEMDTDVTREASDSSLENDEDVVFMVDRDLVMQLQSRFGGMLRRNMIDERTVVYFPLSLARQLHSYVMDSIKEQMEEQNAFTEEIVSKDEELALRLHEQEFSRIHGQPTLQEIMDEEVALRKSQVQKEREGSKTMAGKLSLQLLIERFPQMDPATLSIILEDTNNSLHQATQLLTTAGHISAQTQESSTYSSEEQHVLSRGEAIIQAKAYEDVSSQLYELRKDCLQKAHSAYRDGNKSVAVYYSQMAKWYMERIEKSNSIAAKAILYGYEGWTTLDLHFLQVNEALNVLDLFVDEVIRGLQESKIRKSVVYIITGRGNHSVGGRPRLKPAVKSRLSKRELQFFEQNPGMLKVIIPRSALISYNRDIEVTV